MYWLVSVWDPSHLPKYQFYLADPAKCRQVRASCQTGHQKCTFEGLSQPVKHTHYTCTLCDNSDSPWLYCHTDKTGSGTKIPMFNEVFLKIKLSNKIWESKPTNNLKRQILHIMWPNKIGKKVTTKLPQSQEISFLLPFSFPDSFWLSY